MNRRKLDPSAGSPVEPVEPFEPGEGADSRAMRPSGRSRSSPLPRFLRGAALRSLPALCSLFAGLYAPLSLSAAGAAATTEERVLLTGTAFGEDNEAIDFRISAKSRQDPVGGHIRFAQSEYEITRISRHGLIGARRFIDGGSPDTRHAEFAVFSSSFSDRKATGKPWVAARQVHGCDEAYNAFIALYLIEGEDAVKAIGAAPYARLVEDPSLSAQSRILCFTATPPR